MRKLTFAITILLYIFTVVPANGQNRVDREKNKKTDKKTVKQDTGKLDTTNLSTKTGKSSIGSGATMTDTSSVTPPDKTKTGTDIQPGTATEDPGSGTNNPGEVNPGTVNPGTGTSEPTGKAPPRTM